MPPISTGSPLRYSTYSAASSAVRYPRWRMPKSLTSPDEQAQRVDRDHDLRCPAGEPVEDLHRPVVLELRHRDAPEVVHRRRAAEPFELGLDDEGVDASKDTGVTDEDDLVVLGGAPDVVQLRGQRRVPHIVGVRRKRDAEEGRRPGRGGRESMLRRRANVVSERHHLSSVRPDPPSSILSPVPRRRAVASKRRSSYGRSRPGAARSGSTTVPRPPRRPPRDHGAGCAAPLGRTTRTGIPPGPFARRPLRGKPVVVPVLPAHATGRRVIRRGRRTGDAASHWTRAVVFMFPPRLSADT